MPKNKKPQGGRPNFEPRYGANKTSFHDRHAGRPEGGRSDAGAQRPSSAAQRPGSRSANHRGHRPAEAETGAPKRRWSDQERAGRDEARGIRGRAESGRRETPHHQSERPRTDGRRFNDDRPRFNSDRGAERPRYDSDRGAERPRYNDERPRRDDRARQDERPRRDAGASTGSRYQGDRPRFNSDRGSERPRYTSDRPRYNNERPNDRGNDRPRYDSDRGAERPRYNDERPRRDDRARQDERPRRDAGASTGSRYQGDRPRFDSDRGTERPRYNNDRGSDRPRFNSDRSDRPRSNDDRPRRDDRASQDGRPRYEDRPRVNNERPGRDAATGSAAGSRHQGDRPRRDDVRRDDRGPRRDDRGPRRDDRRSEPRGSRDDWNKTSTTAKFEKTEDVVHERLEAKTIAAPEVEGVTFADLGIGSNIVEVLKDLGATSPFAIQAATIPSILEGRDVLGRGRTGSGKTIAFGAPLVERVLKSQAGKRREFGRKPRAIILAPTRELALQIDRTIQPIARSVGLFTTQIYGGVPQGRQVGALMKGVDIVIGTPGRIEDLIKQRKLDLSDCRIAVLDEADHMCELGFVEPVQRILRHTQEGSQKLLFSATLDREVAALVDEFLVDPAVYEVSGEDQDSGTIDHRVLVIEHRDKADILTSMVDRAGKTLVFARTRAYAETLAEQFDDAGIPAAALHGDLNQAKRTRNLERMTSGRVSVLVATDVAARGIHVDDIDLVIQADAPDEYKTYMHRSGRTGRAGRAGRVVTLITRQRQRRMTELLGRAEIDAPFESARIGDDIIEEITGRMPSNAEITA
ncbi:DEAD/DEAH box helicase [Microbacterium murale]|uniref:Superfamily II DNA/RNA helicase n=1 Tax=Microbacterium murale TaxID=1081040 RepID=A0ABU0PBG9_9MICO|nr:DEAD/DEAH box helicase [Microbacterium murale]MDQ0644006.1 superfamily II DNA/RNA helicase [Microbacterium murale]